MIAAVPVVPPFFRLQPGTPHWMAWVIVVLGTVVVIGGGLWFIIEARKR